MTTTARQADRSDTPRVAEALARSFDDDPVMRWIFCENPVRRARRMRRFFAVEARRHIRQDSAYTDPDRRGAALWSPPGRWRTSGLEVFRSMPTMIPALNIRLPRALRLVGAMEAAHPREPHWYLAVLGTDPDAQGRGIGSALMRPVLERCDREGLGAYLESSKDQNISYYERFGFRVTGEIPLRDGPTLWPMWREPEPGG